MSEKKKDESKKSKPAKASAQAKQSKPAKTANTEKTEKTAKTAQTAKAEKPAKKAGKAKNDLLPSGLEKLPKKAYNKEIKRLQADLVEMQEWVKATGSRLVVIFEGRDAAGKGSAIKRISEYLNPRLCRVVALPAPTERQKTQWYFQRYIEHLPAAGEIVLLDRSWYNRAGVERVMGFCTTDEYRRFLHQAPIFERLLVEDGIMLRKYWFSVSDEEQERRFRNRANDPMRRWKLSPMDIESINKWEEYSRAKDEMFVHTDIPEAPWYTVESEDKKRSRINVMSHLLSTVPWERLDPPKLEVPHRTSSGTYERPPREEFKYVPDVAAKLLGADD
ncbi:polyphosphate kinase 2 [Dietzia sp.]|uniref:polyphosphate kinase 2 n=1 Tax=Dietzia sp. TaxID=1871616 RepID=UPI002FDB885E